MKIKLGHNSGLLIRQDCGFVRRVMRMGVVEISGVWGHNKKALIYKPESSLGTEVAETLTWDFQSPQLWENKVLLFTPLSLGYFVIAARAD